MSDPSQHVEAAVRDLLSTAVLHFEMSRDTLREVSASLRRSQPAQVEEKLTVDAVGRLAQSSAELRSALDELGAKLRERASREPDE